MHVYLTYCDEWLSGEQLNPCMFKLPKKVREDILAYKRPDDATRSFLGKALVAHGFQQMDIPFNWERVQYSSKDRPFLSDPVYDFNISHSGNYVMVVIGKGKVGADIERHRKVDIDIFNRQFNEGEWQTIRNAPDALQQFFDFWAIKEAAIKGDGRGVEILSKTSILPPDRILLEGEEWHYRMLKVADGYSAAVATNASMDSGCVVLKEVACKELFGLLK